ncbi:hypothetical protein K466DRAFT_245788 [Polyporus arcularius HHB13444]|uniref:Uncharacterized protein n=1 Tax=Polyporus arcularius HHB13444 TaxID=1314778 RepID=A0A5C3PXT1_9APHY|nr:hypothetical protein K466DRAFT_245788 [Polyporus arcularius HHB13444]
MSSTDYSFLFSSLNAKQLTTARKVHIRRLYDILQLCIQRHDWVRAKRAWAILARCREVDWKVMWRTSVLLLGEGDPDTNDVQANEDRVRFLSLMMRQHPDERESILKELVLRLIHSGMYRRAMGELDLYLPSYPYQDNPVLHVYAGLVAIHLAQPAEEISEETRYDQGWDANRLRDARAHLERARAIDPSNVVANAFLSQLPGAIQSAQDRTAADSDDEKMDVDAAAQARKRART